MDIEKNALMFSWTRFMSSYFAAPFELRIFTVFIFLVTLTKYSLIWIAPAEIREGILLNIRENASIGYLFSLFFTGYLIYMRHNASRITIILLLAMNMGLFLYHQIKMEYMTYSNWSSQENLFLLTWGLLIPLIWIGVFASPRITRFCQIPEAKA